MPLVSHRTQPRSSALLDQNIILGAYTVQTPVILDEGHRVDSGSRTQAARGRNKAVTRDRSERRAVKQGPAERAQAGQGIVSGVER